MASETNSPGSIVKSVTTVIDFKKPMLPTVGVTIVDATGKPAFGENYCDVKKGLLEIFPSLPCDDDKGEPKPLLLRMELLNDYKHWPVEICDMLPITRPKSNRDRAVRNPRLPKGYGELEIGYYNVKLASAPFNQWRISRIAWKAPKEPRAAKRKQDGESKPTESNKKQKIDEAKPAA